MYNKLPFPLSMITSDCMKKLNKDSIVKSFSLDLLDYPHDIIITSLAPGEVNNVTSHADIPKNNILCISDVCPAANMNTDTITMPKIRDEVSNINSNETNIDLLCSSNLVSFSTFLPNTPNISGSTLDANAKEYTSLVSSNVIRYLLDDSRLGAVAAVSFALTIFIFKSLGFLEVHHYNVIPKDHIKNIKYNHPKNIVLGHLNINSIKNKFQCLKYIVVENIDILLISESKLNESFPEGQFLINGFHLQFRVNRNDKGGGLLLYVKEDIICRVIPINFIPKIEAIVLEINLKKRKWLFTIPTRK